MSENHRHFIVHKPFGCLSQFIYKGKRKKGLLGDLYDFPEGTMAIGRLDEHSEGLLFMTTNGKLSQLVRSSGCEKEYYAQVDGIIDEPAIEQLIRGVEIGIEGQKYTTKPCIAEAIDDPGFPPRIKKIRDDRHGPTSWVRIVLREGKFRQVRKMTSAVGFPTLRLIRVRIGNEKLHVFEPGNIREVNRFDI